MKYVLAFLLVLVGCNGPTEIKGQYAAGTWYVQYKYDDWETWKFACDSTHEILADITRHGGVWEASALNHDPMNIFHDFWLDKQYTDAGSGMKDAEMYVVFHNECKARQ